MKTLFTAIVLAALSLGPTFAQNTVGLISNDPTRTYKGYTLFAPSNGRTTYLIDNDGQVVQEWESDYTPGQAVMLLEDGTLLHTGVAPTTQMAMGGAGGIVEKVAWDGTVTWHYEHYGPNYRQHHDVEIMPNGNILIPVWENHSLNEAISMGRDPARVTDGVLWLERIVEVQPVTADRGKVVWEWYVGEHLIQDFDPTKQNYGEVVKHPEKVNINAGPTAADWLHINSVRYNARRDEITVSVHNLGEIWVISRKTGDIVYRWGNPAVYNAGTEKDRILYGAHDVRWTAEDGSKLLLFNNGLGAPKAMSTVEEISVPLNADGSYVKPSPAFGPAKAAILFPKTPSTSFYAMNISGATRLPNGNVLSCFGPSGTFYESTPDGDIVWKYVNPANIFGVAGQGDTAKNNQVFKIYRYPLDYPGLAGKNLKPRGRLEDGPLSVAEDRFNTGITTNLDILAQRITITVAVPGSYRIEAYDLVGRFLGTIVNEDLAAGTYVRNVPAMTYLIRHN